MRDTDTQAGMSYVWGWQDALKAHGMEPDSNDAFLFGTAWGIVCRLFNEERIYARPNMADAFKMWREEDRRILLVKNVAVYAKTHAGTTSVTVDPVRFETPV